MCFRPATLPTLTGPFLHQAPSNMKGTLIALFYLANAIGDLLTGKVELRFQRHS